MVSTFAFRNLPMFAAFVLLGLTALEMAGTNAATFTLANNCDYTVWPGILAKAGTSPFSTTGFAIQKGASTTLTAPGTWSGRFWGRTHCSTDSTGKFTCATGDCGSGKLESVSPSTKLLPSVSEALPGPMGYRRELRGTIPPPPAPIPGKGRHMLSQEASVPPSEHLAVPASRTLLQSRVKDIAVGEVVTSKKYLLVEDKHPLSGCVLYKACVNGKK